MSSTRHKPTIYWVRLGQKKSNPIISFNPIRRIIRLFGSDTITTLFYIPLLSYLTVARFSPSRPILSLLSSAAPSHSPILNYTVTRFSATVRTWWCCPKAKADFITVHGDARAVYTYALTCEYRIRVCDRAWFCSFPAFFLKMTRRVNGWLLMAIPAFSKPVVFRSRWRHQLVGSIKYSIYKIEWTGMHASLHVCEILF